MSSEQSGQSAFSTVWKRSSVTLDALVLNGGPHSDDTSARRASMRIDRAQSLAASSSARQLGVSPPIDAHTRRIALVQQAAAAAETDSASTDQEDAFFDVSLASARLASTPPRLVPESFADAPSVYFITAHDLVAADNSVTLRASDPVVAGMPPPSPSPPPSPLPPSPPSPLTADSSDNSPLSPSSPSPPPSLSLAPSLSVFDPLLSSSSRTVARSLTSTPSDSEDSLSSSKSQPGATLTASASWASLAPPLASLSSSASSSASPPSSPPPSPPPPATPRRCGGMPAWMLKYMRANAERLLFFAQHGSASIGVVRASIDRRALKSALRRRAEPALSINFIDEATAIHMLRACAGEHADALCAMLDDMIREYDPARQAVVILLVEQGSSSPLIYEPIICAV